MREQFQQCWTCLTLNSHDTCTKLILSRSSNNFWPPPTSACNRMHDITDCTWHAADIHLSWPTCFSALPQFPTFSLLAHFFFLHVTRTSVTSSGVSCGTTWVVDERATVGSGCMPASNKTADGVCGSLQDVLRAKLNSSNRSDSASSCTEVVISDQVDTSCNLSTSHTV